MGTKVGVGESKKTDAFEAGREAAIEALRNAGIDACDFVLVFATSDYDHEKMLKGIRSATGEAPLSGCSAAGVITQSGPAGEGSYTESGLVRGESITGVMAFSSDKIRFHNFLVEGLKENSKERGEELARKINPQLVDPLVLIMLPDGLTVNSDAFFSGIEKSIKQPLLFCGGGASESINAYKTYQFHNDEVHTDSASCVLISGEANIETAINHGCIPISMEKTITKAEANRVFEIDNESIWTFFKSYLPEEIVDFTPEVAGALCLCEKLPEEYATIYDTHIVRAPAAKYPDGSMQFLCEMVNGSKIQMGRRDPDKISKNAKIMAERIRSKLGDKKPVAVLHFDCAARGRLCFGQDAKEKGIDVIQNVFDKDIPWLGLYSYGEIGPISGKNYFHNFTVTLCVIY
ncbi:MAG: FIST C-terminal domain-containing protein [Bacteroidales bacterium]|nr:FIST C-terminal domain-containing protein [Bacteroidales bacterium]